MPRCTLALGALLALILTVSACGDDAGSSSDLADLGARAQPPADVSGPALAAVDFAEVRRQLGLAEDAGFEPDREHPQESLAHAGIAAYVLPFVRRFVSTLQPTAFYEAFDGGAISAAAGPSTGPGGTYLLATSQSFDEIADRLRDAGFEEDDGVLTGIDAPEGETDGEAWSVADAGDGVVVLADSPEAARAAADGDGDDVRRDAFGAVEQPVRFAFVGDPEDEGDCTLRFVAVGQDARPPDGELVVAPVDGDERRATIEEMDNTRPGTGPGFLDAVEEEVGDERVCPST